MSDYEQLLSRNLGPKSLVVHKRICYLWSNSNHVFLFSFSSFSEQRT